MSTLPPVLLRARIALAAVLWAAVAAIGWIVFAGDRAPTATDALVDDAQWILFRAALVAGLLLGVGMLLWPPFIPAIKVGLRRLRESMSVDQRPMNEALARLAHFDNAADHLTVGRTLFRMGAVPRALPHLAKALELDPDSAAARFLSAQALLRVGQVDLASDQLRRTVELDPEHGFGDAMLQYGLTLHRAGDGPGAESVLARHEARFGPSRRADVARARIALALGDRAAATRFATRAARPLEKTPVTNPEEILARAKARVLAMRLGART